MANFKVREGQDTGLKVTLRGLRMYEFLDRMISLVIPRVRDFRGLSPDGFDKNGNYNFGFTEQTVFPEVNSAEVTFQQGMNITMVTTAPTADEGRELLKQFGFPFRTDEEGMAIKVWPQSWRNVVWSRAMATKAWISKAEASRRAGKEIRGASAAVEEGEEFRGVGEVAARFEPDAIAYALSVDRPSRAVYRKFKVSRIMLRELAAGKIPGMKKASW